MPYVRHIVNWTKVPRPIYVCLVWYNTFVMRDILSKYNLPRRVEVTLNESKEGGFVVEFPDLAGCFTQVEDLSKLPEQVTDAVLTYFDVPRGDAGRAVYLPEEKATREEISLSKINLETRFDLFIAA